MLLYHNLILSLTSLINYGKVIPYFSLSSLKWNAKSRRLVRLKSSSTKLCTWRCKFCASLMMLCGLETVRHILSNNGTYTSFTDICLASFTATCLISMAHLLWGLGSKSDQIMQYINGMLELEQEYLKGGIIVPFDNYTKVASCISAILAILARAVPLLFGFASGIDPQFPANMLSFGFRKYLRFQFFVEYPFTLAIISLIVNIFIYYLVSFIGALFGAHFFISFATARNLLFCVLRSVDRAQIIYDLVSLPHASPKENKLQLALSKTVQQTVVRGYRKMQLLWNVFNHIHSSFLVNFVLANEHVQILSVCFVIQISKRATQQHTSFFPCLLATMATIDAICIIIGIFSSSAGVHSASVQVKTRLTEYQKRRMMRGIMMTKIIQSLPEVRTKFGVSNFIDKLTPLKFQSFIINRILDLLLCGYNHKN